MSSATITADDIACVSTKSIDKYFLQNVGHGTVDIARMLLELIYIYTTLFTISSKKNNKNEKNNSTKTQTNSNNGQTQTLTTVCT